MRTKICTKCHRELPATRKYFHKALPTYKYKYNLKAMCIKCSRTYSKNWMFKNRKQFSKYKKVYRKVHKSEILKYLKKYRNKNKITLREINKLRGRKRGRLWRYGLTLEDFYKLLNKQKNRCKLCRIKFRKTKDAYTDHDHKTGKIRGLLCMRCNFNIGVFEKLMHNFGYTKIVNYLKGNKCLLN